MDNTQKFSGRANDYTVGRPAYAKTFIEYLYSEQGLSDKSVIADIGAGTGKFAKQLLDKGSFVYCVEPNDDMRKVAIEELRRYAKACIVNGRASETMLKDNSVDFVTTAQAFHWFDVDMFRSECKRILKGDGKVILIWNVRDMSSQVNSESYDIFSRYCPNFQGFSGGIKKDDWRIQEFFSDNYEYAEFDNPLFYDRDKFISRSLSSSYSLKKADSDYQKYIDELSMIFERHEKDGVVEVGNRTVAYIGGLK